MPHGRRLPAPEGSRGCCKIPVRMQIGHSPRRSPVPSVQFQTVRADTGYICATTPGKTEAPCRSTLED